MGCTIEVWEGALGAEDPFVSAPLYSGELVATENRVIVGNTVGNEFYEVPITAGRHQVQVLRSPVGEPAKVVYFVLD